LIAEDDPVTRRLLEARLRKWGHEVLACSDGAAAWEILKKKDAPRLVILDWMMPEMEGVEVCRQVRALKRERYVYVIILTGKDSTEDVVSGLEAGADDYVIKPFDPYELRVRIESGRRVVELQSQLIEAKANVETVNDELKRAHDELEQRVAERTADLVRSNERLRDEIAERRRARQAVGKTEARYRELVENANSIIMRLTPDGKVAFFNEFAQGFFGYNEDEIRGRDVVGTIVPETESPAPNLRTVVRHIVGDPDGYATIESDNINRDGRRVWVSWTNKAVVDEDGRIVEVLCVGNDITKLKEAEERIRSSLQEKETLLQEIHHRVKNNLQVISSLLGLQTRRVKDEKVVAALKDSQIRVRSMALIHEQLYRSSDLSRIDFRGYVKALSGALLQTYSETAGRVSFKIDSDRVFVGIATAIPCGLIINELVSNCLKHAFEGERAGEIRVELRYNLGFAPLLRL